MGVGVDGAGGFGGGGAGAGCTAGVVVAATLVATVGGSPVEVALSTPVLISLRSQVWVLGTVS